MRILFLPGSLHAPAARFRIWQFVEPLRSLGHNVEVRVVTPERYWTHRTRNSFLRRIVGYGAALFRFISAIWITRDIERFDIVMMNRDLVPETGIDFIEPWLSRRNPGLIFDFDDAIFLGARERKMRRILPLFSAVTAGNEYLATFARQLNDNVEIWPTVVDTDRFRPAASRLPGPVRIGWSGSSSTLAYCLPLLRNVIVDLARTQDFEFIVIADQAPTEKWPGVKMKYIPWSPETEVESLQLFDIGLMPLRDEPFERGKCGAKAITYMSIGIPSLVSPVGVNADIIIHGENGFHCRSDQEWLEGLQFLLHDDSLRIRMGIKALERVESNYSVNSLLPSMTDLFERISKKR